MDLTGIVLHEVLYFLFYFPFYFPFYFLFSNSLQIYDYIIVQ